MGPRRGYATADEERRLTEKRRSGDLPFDQHPVVGSSIEEIDVDLFLRTYLPAAVAPGVLEENKRSPEQQLASLRFLTPDGVPTVAGVLVLGKDPRRWFPGAYIQFVRYEGTTITDPILDQREIAGPLPDVLRMLDELLSINVATASDMTSGPVEVRRPDIPLVALQQLARNAVLHRTYEGTNAPVRIYWFAERVEISSPGGPYGMVNDKNFGQPGITDYRNPQLAEAMKVLGYVQKFGVGIALARSELAKNGNPSLSFDIQPTHVLATIWKLR